MERIETTILRNLIHNEEFVRKASPFLKQEYFSDNAERLVFSEILSFINKYSTNPSFSAIKVILTEKDGIPESIYEELEGVLKLLSDYEPVELQWLLDETEKFCKKQALYNAISQCVVVMEGKDKKMSTDAMPELLTKALSVSFNTAIGHDYLEDADDRWSYFNDADNSPRIPFDIDMLNKVTRGGLKPGTLNVLLGGTGSGKSLNMCHYAAANLSMGYNVLYITLEMAEQEIAQRIDANRMNVNMSELDKIDRDIYLTRIDKIKERAQGKLIIKEFPTSSGNANHFRALLSELKIKKSFIPDIIYIDYLNICASTRVGAGSGANSYTVIKAIAEELRALSQENNCPIVSATQTNRGAQGASDVGMEDVSESHGLPVTVDLLWGLICTEDMEADKRLMYVQLKSRYSNIAHDRRFMVGIDKDKMKLFNMDNNNGFGPKSQDDDKEDKKFRHAKVAKDFSGIKL
jgi:replicative DNA helicase